MRSDLGYQQGWGSHVGDIQEGFGGQEGHGGKTRTGHGRKTRTGQAQSLHYWDNAENISPK
jgi:hypothetical protein